MITWTYDKYKYKGYSLGQHIRYKEHKKDKKCLDGEIIGFCTEKNAKFPVYVLADKDGTSLKQFEFLINLHDNVFTSFINYQTCKFKCISFDSIFNDKLSTEFKLDKIIRLDNLELKVTEVNQQYKDRCSGYYFNKSKYKCSFTDYFGTDVKCEYWNRKDKKDIIFKLVKPIFTVKRLKSIISKLPDDYEVCIGTNGVILSVDDILPIDEVLTLKLECPPKDFIEGSNYVIDNEE